MLSSNLSSAALGSHPEEVLLHMLRARPVVCNCWAVSYTGSVACAEPCCMCTVLVCPGCAGLAGEMQLVRCGAGVTALRLASLGGFVREMQLVRTGNEARKPRDMPNCSGSLAAGSGGEPHP